MNQFCVRLGMKQRMPSQSLKFRRNLCQNSENGKHTHNCLHCCAATFCNTLPHSHFRHLSRSMWGQHNNKQKRRKYFSTLTIFVGFILFNLQVYKQVQWTLILMANRYCRIIHPQYLIPIIVVLIMKLLISIIYRVFLNVTHQVFVIKYYKKLFFLTNLFRYMNRINYELDIFNIIVLKYNFTHGISMCSNNYDIMIIYFYVLIQNQTGISQINCIIIITWSIIEYIKYKWRLCIFLISLFEKRLHLLSQLTICNYITYSMIIRSCLRLIMLLLSINFIFQTKNKYNCQISRVKYNTSDYNGYYDQSSRHIAKTKIKNGFSSRMAIFMTHNTWYNVEYYATLLYLDIISVSMQKICSKITLLMIFYIINHHMVNYNKPIIFNHEKRVLQKTLIVMVNFIENAYGSYVLLLLITMLLYMLIMIQKEKLKKLQFMALKVALELAWCVSSITRKTETEIEKEKHLLFENFYFW